MFFRNLTLFRFSPSVAPLLNRDYAQLVRHKLRAPGPLEVQTIGFVSPYGPDSQVLLRSDESFQWFTLGREQRLLPANVVNTEINKRLHAEAERRARPVGGRQRRAIRNEVLDVLLPQAFVQATRINAYLDRDRGWRVIDTASYKIAEMVLTKLREALGSFPAVPLAPNNPPRLLMTEWLANGRLPGGLFLGDECELRDPASRATVICRQQELESGEVHQHLKQGKQPFRLGLQFGDRASFVLGEDLVIRKFRFLDIVQDSIDHGDGADSVYAELDARFALMAREIQPLLDSLEEWFGLERPSP